MRPSIAGVKIPFILNVANCERVCKANSAYVLMLRYYYIFNTRVHCF